MNTSIGGKISIRKQKNCFLPQFVESASQEGIFRCFFNIHTIVIPSQMLQRGVRLTKLASLSKISDIFKVSSISIRSKERLVSNKVSSMHGL